MSTFTNAVVRKTNTSTTRFGEIDDMEFFAVDGLEHVWLKLPYGVYDATVAGDYDAVNALCLPLNGRRYWFESDTIVERVDMAVQPVFVLRMDPSADKKE